MTRPGLMALVVDDNPTARELVRTLLTHRGLEAVEADDGAEALELARQRRPDLVISDILMPTMDGYEFVRRLREDGLKTTPVIFYTATYHEPAAVVLASQAGARVVFKDGEVERLLEAIDDSLSEIDEQPGMASVARLQSPTASFQQDHVRLLTNKLVDQGRALGIATVRLSAVLRLSEGIALSPTRAGVLDGAARAARDLLSCAFAGAILFERGTTKRVVAIHGLDPVATERLNDPNADWADLRRPFETGETIRRPANRVGAVGADSALPWSEAVLAVPAGGIDARHGTVFAAGPIGRDEFTPEDEQVLLALARQAAIGLDRVRLQEELGHAQRMEAVGRLAGGIAHDFNNVLMAILGYSDLLMASFEPDDPRREEVRAIRDAGDRATALTSRLLSFSRRQVVVPQTVDLNAAIESVARLLARVVGEDVAIELGLHGGPVPVHLDPSQLEQVVINLAINARDAMPDGGRLRIETRIDDEGSPPGAVLVVADTGTGMDEATMALAFEAFFTTKSDGRGTGLGLSTVQSAVSSWGGTIEVSSQPGAGTAFLVRIPLAGEDLPAAPAADAGPHPADATGSEHILVVEDEKHVRELVAETLIRAGYRVTTGASLAEATTILESEAGQIDLLITDLILADGTGVQVATMGRSLRPDLPIIMMSGYADRDVLEDPLVTTSPFLPKPFRSSELRQAVRHAIDAV